MQEDIKLLNADSSYKRIVKSTGIYGTSQLINIALGIIRSKITALLLGPTGVGLISLYQSVIDLSRSTTGLGLDTGATKQIATSKEEDRTQTIDTVNTWYFITAIFGALLCITLSKQLSIWTFGVSDYSYQISIIALAVLFITLNAGIIACFQGLRKIHFMAWTASLGSFFGLLVTIPLYYFFRLDGIIWALVGASFVSFGVSLFFYRKLGIKFNLIPLTKVWNNGQQMIRLGVYIVMAGIISSMCLYSVRSYINKIAGVNEVGLFQAAWLTTFIISGIVLRSANSDFFPKLCSIIDQDSQVRRFVNQQTHILLLIISPLIIGIFTFADSVIYLLYSSDFLSSTLTFRWYLIAIFLKMTSTPIASVLLAKNKGRYHLLCESLFWLIFFLVSLFLYPILGLKATGIAYLIAYIVYLPVILLISNRISTTKWDAPIVRMLFIVLILLCLLLCVSAFFDRYTLLIGLIAFIASLVYSLSRLNSLIGLKFWNWRKNRKE